MTRSTSIRSAAAIAALLAPSACAAGPGNSAPAAGASDRLLVEASPSDSVFDVVVVPEHFITAYDDVDDLDTPAVWFPSETGSTPLLITTAKQTDVLVVHDAANGGEIRRVGGSGSGAGEFERPNAVAVIDDFAVVVERDNRRIQLLSLPGFDTVALFGDDVLEKPYGVAWAREDSSGDGAVRLFVTDDFDVMDDSLRLLRAPSDRVKVFTLRSVGSDLAHEYVGSFGDDDGPGALWTVESIWADAPRQRLLVADEFEKAFKVYDLDGTFTGDLVGSGMFVGDPEGIALWECGTGGYWVITDQQDSTSLFHVLDRETLVRVGVFRGSTTANTDGITVVSRAVGDMAGGAVYAIHDDGAIAAFSWTDVADAIGVAASCGVSPGG